MQSNLKLRPCTRTGYIQVLTTSVESEVEWVHFMQDISHENSLHRRHNKNLIGMQIRIASYLEK